MITISPSGSKSWIRSLLLLSAVHLNLFTICTVITGCGSGGTPGLAPSILSFSTIPNHIYGDAPFAVSASSKSSAAIKYALLSGPATLTGNFVTITGTGTITLSATQVADINNPAQAATASFAVNPATPVLNFAAIANHSYGDAAFPVSASSTSDGLISYAIVSGPATVAGNIVTLTGPGTLSLRATQAATTNYTSQTATTSFAVAAAAPILVTVSPSSLSPGGSAQCLATRLGQAVTGGRWVILGGVSNGTIDANGTYHSPAIIPSPNSVTIGYVLSDQTYSATLSISDQVPTVESLSPTVLTKIQTYLTVTGTGFVPGSVITLNGSPVQTSYLDPTHLAATIDIKSPVNAVFQIGATNPAPGAVSSLPFNISSQFQQITVMPQQLSGGPITISLSGAGFHAGSVVFLDGSPLVTTLNSPSSITATGFLAPWKTGTVTLELVDSAGTNTIAQQSVPIAATAVSYDAAARFTTQAAFGPRPDLVDHIQHVGFETFIAEQLNQPIVEYTPKVFSIKSFLGSAAQGDSLLRQRVAWALQNFIVPSGNSNPVVSIPIECTFERDATGNFRTLMSDIVADPNIGIFLNLVNNPVPNDPSIHPNQNFARELMQLFTLGPQRLNDDGTTMLDASGHPIPTYDQDTVIDLTRALTGWNIPTPVDPDYTAWGIDYSQPLSGSDDQHDHTAKLLFGSTILPAGQNIQQDRDTALDAIFYHPNLPPFVSRILIQHLVKSNPSPSYTYRISQVFKDDGTGTRGNLAAVIRAILLDPEARLGDTTPSPDDGFIQDPVLFQTFVMSILQVPLGDDQSVYVPGSLGEPIWHAPTIFGFYDPAYRIPGTSINAPEFALFNNIAALHRSQVLWGIVSGTQPGFLPYTSSSWLFNNFTTVPDMIDALNHLAYHGRMSATQQQVILNYCSQMNPYLRTLQLQTAVFLALNSDSYTVAN
jgi:uncharacterized protein (DUF1800 family)